MYVIDLESVKDFFVRYFNASANNMYHNKRTDFKSYFLSFGDGSCLEIMNRPGLLNKEKHALRCGLAHLGMSLGSKEKVDALTDLLRRDGYEVISGPRTTGDGCYESCIFGPENNVIELTV